MNRFTPAALAVAGLLAIPSIASASEEFGSQLKHGPANGPETCEINDVAQPCSFVGYRHPTPPEGDNVPRPAPFDGVVTKLRIRSYTPDPVTFIFAKITEEGTGKDRHGVASLDAVGPSVTFTGTGEVEEFAARVPVHQGAHVGLNALKHGATYNSDGGKDSYEFTPQLGGAAQKSSGDTGGELLVQAVIEPDVDRDGFGDETQDTDGITPKVDADRLAPKLTKLGLTRAGIKLTLSEAGKVTVRVRRNGKTIRTLVRTRGAGKQTIAMSRRALKAGRYTLQVSAKDAAGNTSTSKSLSFRKR
ncbi:MAG TPA: Ig-like domain-containing protein [Solirubrobacteraceae bacterium]